MSGWVLAQGEHFWLSHHVEFGLLAGVILIIKQIPYIVSMVRSTTRPARISWAIWAVIATIALVEYVQEADGAEIIVPALTTLSPITILVLSFWFGTRDRGGIDSIAVAGSLISLAVWFLTGSATLGLLALIAADALATVPTLRKSFHWPESESLLAWSLGLLGFAVNLLAVEEWTFEEGVYPVYLVFFAGSIVTAILLGRRARPATTLPGASAAP